MYLYELPTTGAISFSDFCVDHTANRRHLLHIPTATEARANIRAILKESKRTEHGQKDFLQLVKLLDEYIPQLRGLMACTAHDEIGLKSEPSFSWRTTLSANIFNNSPRISLPSLHADLAFSLLTYAFALANLGRATALSLGRYERDRAISDEERKAKDAQLNVALDFLRRASGVFTYIGSTVLPDWDTDMRGGTAGFEKPPEISREVNTALAKMALADGTNLAIRSLLSKAAYDSNIAPGPPLPKSHPPPAFIAKLHLECASLYNSSLSLVKATGAKEVAPELRRYLADELAFHTALSRKWLGVDAGEKGGKDRGGEAVGFLAWAKKDLETLKDSIKSVSLGKGDQKDVKGRLKERVTDELQNVTVFYKYYKKTNDTIHFQPVPTQADLQAKIPAGMSAVGAKPYTPLPPAFEPSSEAQVEAELGNLHISNSEGEAEQELSHSATSPPPPGGDYAGAGSYF